MTAARGVKPWRIHAESLVFIGDPQVLCAFAAFLGSVSALRSTPKLLRRSASPTWLCPSPPPEGEEVGWDYAATEVKLRNHIPTLLRPELAA